MVPHRFREDLVCKIVSACKFLFACLKIFAFLLIWLITTLKGAFQTVASWRLYLQRVNLSFLFSVWKILVNFSWCITNKDIKGRIRIGPYLLLTGKRIYRERAWSNVYKLEVSWLKICAFFLISHSCICGDRLRGLSVCPRILVGGGVNGEKLSREAGNMIWDNTSLDWSGLLLCKLVIYNSIIDTWQDSSGFHPPNWVVFQPLKWK